MDMDEFYIALHSAGKGAEGGISGVARRLALREQVLVNKLNPNSPESEPKISEFIRILRDTGNLEPLEILCLMFDGRFVTRSTDVGSSLMGTLLSTVNEMSDIPRVGEQAMADGRVTAEECRGWLKEIGEARDALARLENTILAHRDQEVC